MSLGVLVEPEFVGILENDDMECHRDNVGCYRGSCELVSLKWSERELRCEVDELRVANPKSQKEMRCVSLSIWNKPARNFEDEILLRGEGGRDYNIPINRE